MALKLTAVAVSSRGSGGSHCIFRENLLEEPPICYRKIGIINKLFRNPARIPVEATRRQGDMEFRGDDPRERVSKKSVRKRADFGAFFCWFTCPGVLFPLSQPVGRGFTGPPGFLN
jgi:hypothetical protein